MVLGVGGRVVGGNGRDQDAADLGVHGAIIRCGRGGRCAAGGSAAGCGTTCGGRRLWIGPQQRVGEIVERRRWAGSAGDAGRGGTHGRGRCRRAADLFNGGSEQDRRHHDADRPNDKPARGVAEIRLTGVDRHRLAAQPSGDVTARGKADRLGENQPYRAENRERARGRRGGERRRQRKSYTRSQRDKDEGDGNGGERPGNDAAPGQPAPRERAPHSRILRFDDLNAIADDCRFGHDELLAFPEDWLVA